MLEKIDRSSYEYLKYSVYKLHPDISERVFQPELNRAGAESYLTKNKSVPFVIRRSNMNGFYSITYLDSITKKYNHGLIKPPSNEDSDYSLWSVDENGLKQSKHSFQDFLMNYWSTNQSLGTKSGNELRNRWLQFKKDNKSAPDLKVVLSLQSLDNRKVAFTPNQVQAYIEKNKNSVNQPGDGHTGLALASALGSAPFVVMRSVGNRDQAAEALSGHIGDGGLVVITGHSSPDSDKISGNYGVDHFSEQISRGPEDIVSLMKEAGIEKESHITIVLGICYGAKSIESRESSFAHKLAKEFAKSGISTTIIASDKPVIRFGTGVIQDESIHFGNNVGIDRDSVNVLFTEADPRGGKSSTNIFKPHENLHISEKGLRFTSPIEYKKDNNTAAEVAVQEEQAKPKSSTSSQKDVAASKLEETTVESVHTQHSIFAAQAKDKSDNTEPQNTSLPFPRST